MRPRIMSARRFWDIHIRQVEASATRVFSRTEEGSYMCIPFMLYSMTELKDMGWK